MNKKQAIVYVFGHRNPDTDAICAAIAYADLLKQTRYPNATAACCGPPNARTEFALRKAGLSPPRIVMDIRPEVEEVCRNKPVVAYDDEVFHDVYRRMQSHGISAVPVLDRQEQFVGIATLLDLMRVVFEGDEDPLRARRVDSSVRQIANVLEGRLAHAVEPDMATELTVMVGAMSAEGFTQRLHQYPAEKLMVVCGNRPTIQLPALEHGVRVLVVTGGYELSPGLLQLARSNGVNVIISDFDTATTTLRIKSARRIAPAIQRNCTVLPARMPVADARKIIERSSQRLFPVVNDPGQLIGVLSKSDLFNPPRPKLVLVDHNELSQAVTGADEAEILEVLDHHRLGGGLRSDQPIRFINEPVGSTCTLVARQFRAAGIRPNPGIALCMASGIISDTLNLRSPTTTDIDRETLAWLREHVSVDLDQFIKEFFEVGSSLRSHPASQVVREDCKEFEDRGFRFAIAQIEEIGYELFWQRQEELLAALQELKRERNLDFAALLVTDIVSQNSLLLLSDEPEFWEAINYPSVGKGLYQLDNVVSRKKQLLPLISRLLESAAQTVD